MKEIRYETMHTGGSATSEKDKCRHRHQRNDFVNECFICLWKVWWPHSHREPEDKNTHFLCHITFRIFQISWNSL